MIVQEPIHAAIWHALNHYAYGDAVFLAERLYAEVGTDETLYLLATSYYRAGKTTSAYSLLNAKGSLIPQCRYLLARCCVDLKKFTEAELVLTGNSITQQKSLEEISGEFGESASFALQILADLYKRSERQAKSVEAYKRSLKANPFLWTSYENIVNLGEKLDPSKVFVISDLPTFSQGYNSMLNKENTCYLENVDNQLNKTPLIKSTPQDMILPERLPPNPKLNTSRITDSRSFSIGSPTTFSPSFGVFPLDCSTPAHIQSTPVTRDLDASSGAQKIITRRSGNKFQILGVSSSNNMTSSSPAVSTPGVLETLGSRHVRRSSRLFTSGSGGKSVKENNKGISHRGNKCAVKISKSHRPSKFTTLQETSEISDVSSPIHQATPSSSTQAQVAFSMQKASAEGLMQLLQELGRAQYYLSTYQIPKAVETIHRLPPHHYHTGWVLTLLGRAYFEVAEYPQAKEVFEQARHLEPYRLEGLEYYSTTLWHLQQEVALSALASEFIETNKDSPQTWCFAGNCFSLQKEHETSVKFLQRATQVDPEFAYAFTLLGHELVFLEELDRAMNAFRTAIRIDNRHYNAWYGIGMIYYKQEKYHLAEVHFKKAHLINPSNAILLCHIGIVQQALKRTDQALITLNRALKLSPRNPLCKFHHASVYFQMECYQETLKELEELKEIVPKESLVYFLVGKVHKNLNNTHLALMNFSWAMDLDPKGSNNQIKELIDKQYMVEEEEEPPLHSLPTAEANSPPPPALRGSSRGSRGLEEPLLQPMESDESF